MRKVIRVIRARSIDEMGDGGDQRPINRDHLPWGNVHKADDDDPEEKENEMMMRMIMMGTWRGKGAVAILRFLFTIFCFSSLLRIC